MTALCLLDNIVLPGFLAGLRPRSEVTARGEELMERMGIAELATSGVTEAPSATACDGAGSVASAAAAATARGRGGDIAQAQQVTGLVPGGDALRRSRSQGRRHR